jgi:hypothetical protein
MNTNSRLDRVLGNQRKHIVANLAAMAAFASSIVVSLATVL